MLDPIHKLLKLHNLVAKKSFGQNFLLDLNITNKIASFAGNLNEQNVIEIGPGPGGLSRAILEQGANLIAIEKDQRFLPILEQLQKYYSNKLKIIYGDALSQQYETLTHDPYIIANLPYNIGTKLLLSWLTKEPFYKAMILMFQKEVAERIVAKPNNSKYGRLSVIANWRCNTRIIYQLPASVFTPSPKIDSAVVFLEPKPTLKCNLACLELVTKEAFGQRRKMLRKALQNIGGVKLLEKARIDTELRAENLTVEQFVTLANSFHSLNY